MRLALTPDTVSVFTPEGVYLRNNGGAYLLQGGAVACEFYRRLEPLLDGRADLDAALAPVSPAKRGEALRIVGILRDRGYVVDAEAPPPAPERCDLAWTLLPGRHEAVVHPAGFCADCLRLRAADLTPPAPSGALDDDDLLRRYAAALAEAKRPARDELVIVGANGTSVHTAAPHPLCPRCGGLGSARRNRGFEAMAALTGLGTAPPAECSTVDLLDAVEPLKDARFGPIFKIHESDFTQLPLTRSEVVSVDGTTIASGFDYFESRRRALAAALERYARRGVEERMWGVAMPSLEIVATAPGAVSTASGASYEELFLAAVVAEERRLLECAVAEKTAALVELEHDAAARHRAILRRYGIVPRLAVPADARLVPAVVATADGIDVVAAAPTLDEAIADALRRLIARIQAGDHGEPPDSDGGCVAANRAMAATVLERMARSGRHGVLVPHLVLPLSGAQWIAGSFHFDPEPHATAAVRDAEIADVR